MKNRLNLATELTICSKVFPKIIKTLLKSKTNGQASSEKQQKELDNILSRWYYSFCFYADVAELADALDLGSSG